MAKENKNPRVLIVTPEVTYLPQGMGNIANYFSAKAGGLADVSASLISKLFSLGADVHVAMPDYRGIFNSNIGPLGALYEKELAIYRKYLPEERLHLAEDRAESRDLADRFPDRVDELQSAYDAWAGRANVLPWPLR